MLAARADDVLKFGTIKGSVTMRCTAVHHPQHKNGEGDGHVPVRRGGKGSYKAAPSSEGHCMRWFGYKVKLSEQYDKYLCPVLHHDVDRKVPPV